MRIHLFFIYLFFTSLALGQGESEKLNLFLDCQTRCDLTYLRQKMTFVNYMQNRDDADIYVLATSIRAGSGGRQVQLAFQGEGDYQLERDTITFQTDPNATDAILRDQFMGELKKGLLPYLLLSPQAKNIEYTVKEIEQDSKDEGNVDDPWNYWVFNVGGNGNISGESNFSSTFLRGRFNSSRVTEQSKFQYFFNYSFEENLFKLTDGEEFTSIIKRYNNFIRYVHSINDHWSVGAVAEAGSSTFGNTDFDATLKPAIEYNVYPYKDANTRRFTFQYSIGPEYKDYTDITIYDKLKETVVRHQFNIEFEQVQKWGTFELDFGAAQYLHNTSLYNAFINPNLEWVIYKGLSLDLGGFASLVSDRINIAKSEISDEDILLQIKQLDTNFFYFSYVGLNFRFGSKYNNFVNPRF